MKTPGAVSCSLLIHPASLTMFALKKSSGCEPECIMLYYYLHLHKSSPSDFKVSQPSAAGPEKTPNEKITILILKLMLNESETEI